MRSDKGPESYAVGRCFAANVGAWDGWQEGGYGVPFERRIPFWKKWTKGGHYISDILVCFEEKQDNLPTLEIKV